MIMALIKHVDGVDIEMTPEEEAKFLADLPPPFVPPTKREPTKEELQAELQKLASKIESLK